MQLPGQFGHVDSGCDVDVQAPVFGQVQVDRGLFTDEVFVTGLFLIANLDFEFTHNIRVLTSRGK